MSETLKPKTYHGSPYLMENVNRALRCLAGDSPDHIKRLKDACSDAHRPGRYPGTTDAMSLSTLKAWDACSSSNWDKRIEEMDGEEISELKGNLFTYLMGMCVDYGIARAGQEPSDWHSGLPVCSYNDADEIRQERKEVLEGRETE